MIIRINANQLPHKLTQNNSSQHYFLVIGNDPYLQHTAQLDVKTSLRHLGFAEQLSFTINNQTDWDIIIESSQSISLFSSQTLIILQFGETGLNTAIANKLNELTKNISPDVSLLISLAKMTKVQENAQWFKNLADQLIVVNCTTPDISQLPKWINEQLKAHNLTLDKDCVDLLCYYYEGNLLALSQTLEQLVLLYPSGKITYNQLENNLNDAAIFTPYHWIDAMLAIKPKRALHVLRQLLLNDMEPLILLRTIQRELIQLINVKKQAQKSDLKTAYDMYKVWQNRRNLLTPYINKITLTQLYSVLNTLVELELLLKHDYSAAIEEPLSILSLRFMGLKHE